MSDVPAGDEGDPRPFHRGGLVVGPDGSDAVPWFPMEREAVVDRHGRVICRYVGGRFIPAGTDYGEAVAALIADRLPEVEVRIVADVAEFRRQLLASIMAADERGHE